MCRVRGALPIHAVGKVEAEAEAVDVRSLIRFPGTDEPVGAAAASTIGSTQPITDDRVLGRSGSSPAIGYPHIVFPTALGGASHRAEAATHATRTDVCVLTSVRFRGNARSSLGVLQEDIDRKSVIHRLATPACDGRVLVDVDALLPVILWQLPPVG